MEDKQKRELEQEYTLRDLLPPIKPYLQTLPELSLAGDQHRNYVCVWGGEWISNPLVARETVKGFLQEGFSSKISI